MKTNLKFNVLKLRAVLIMFNIYEIAMELVKDLSWLSYDDVRIP